MSCDANDDRELLAQARNMAERAFSREMRVDPYGKIVFYLSFVLALRNLRIYYTEESAARRVELLESFEGLESSARDLRLECEPTYAYIAETLADLRQDPVPLAVHRDAWKEYELSQAALRVPSMLDEDTKRYYATLASWLAGDGAVVEIGCWLGSSTRCMLEGLDANSNWTWRAPFVVCDPFRWEPWMGRHVEDWVARAFAPGDSFLEAFLEQMTPFQDHIDTLVWTPETVTAHPWPERIELFVYDATQEYDVLLAYWQALRPALLPGRSLVVLNTYGSPRSESLRRFARERRDFLRPVHKPRGSAKTFLYLGEQGVSDS